MFVQVPILHRLKDRLQVCVMLYRVIDEPSREFVAVLQRLPRCMLLTF